MMEFTNLGFLCTVMVCSVVVQSVDSVLRCKQPSLVWHNHYRKIHQVSNVTWSKKLWSQANSWANRLARTNTFEHEPGNPGNLFLSPGRPSEPCAMAVKLFYSEEKYYNYKKPQYYKAAGHFTQLVWKNTKQIGAVSKLRRDGKTVVVVKYFPPGNVQGHFAKNVLPPKKHIVTTPRTPTVTTSGNTTSKKYTTTVKPKLYVRAGVSSVNAWRGVQFAVQWLLFGFVLC